jgi:hypothetical protein
MAEEITAFVCCQCGEVHKTVLCPETCSNCGNIGEGLPLCLELAPEGQKGFKIARVPLD